MYKVRKLFEQIPIGHRLSKHKGLCKNIHGHNFNIEVQVKSEDLNEDDMVIDFHDLKTIVEKILDSLDHATLLNPEDQVNVKHFKEQGFKMVNILDDGMNVDPTAEVLAKYLYCTLDGWLKSEGVRVDFIRIWENDRGMAEYSEE